MELDSFVLTKIGIKQSDTSWFKHLSMTWMNRLKHSSSAGVVTSNWVQASKDNEIILKLFELL